jgi:AraC-like DNA-binding protein
MLISSKKNVTEVASVLNYSTPFAFTKAFKKEFGISPKEYVKRKKGKV